MDPVLSIHPCCWFIVSRIPGCGTSAGLALVVSSLIKFRFSLRFRSESYSTSQKNFAVGRPSPADRSEPLIAACRLHLDNGGERQTPVIFTPRAVLDPMLQTMMDPGTSLPVIPLHESQITAVRLTGGNSFRSLHMYALCTLYTGRIK